MASANIADMYTTIYLGRQPIVDVQQQRVAYELLFRSGQMEHAEFSSDVSATARVITTVFNELGLENSLGNAFGFTPMGNEKITAACVAQTGNNLAGA